MQKWLGMDRKEDKVSGEEGKQIMDNESRDRREEHLEDGTTAETEERIRIREKQIVDSSNRLKG